MEKLEKEILKLLQNGEMCSPKVSKIAKKLEKSLPTIHRKIKTLEKQGYITEYVAHVDSQKLDKEVTAFTQIKLSYPSKGGKTHAELIEKKVQRLAKLPEIQEMYTIAGKWDFLLKIKTKNLTELYEFVSNNINSMEGVTEVGSTIMLKTFKESSYIDP